MSDLEKWLNGVAESQDELAKKHIGVKFGIYETVDAWFDKISCRQLCKVRCTKCGAESTVDSRLWRDWVRGKGRSQEKCKNCEKIKKEQAAEAKRLEAEKRVAERERKKAEAEAKKRERLKYQYGDYIGKKYGHLTVEGYDRGEWICRCDCGKQCVKSPTLVVYGEITTCGSVSCQYRNVFANTGNIVRQMGKEFEKKQYEFLIQHGYKAMQTPYSGDYGVDLIAIGKNQARCAFQLKQNFKSKSPVGSKAVMEVYAGGAYYDCDKRFVVSTTGYTANAIRMAEKLNVILLNGDFQLYENGKESFVKQFTINGITKYKTEWCDDYHTTWETVQKKMKLLNLSFEEALRNTEQIKGEIYEINGEKHTMQGWCEKYNQLQPTIAYRMKQGMSLQQALEMPSMKQNKRLHGKPINF